METSSCRRELGLPLAAGAVPAAGMAALAAAPEVMATPWPFTDRYVVDTDAIDISCDHFLFTNLIAISLHAIQLSICRFSLLSILMLSSMMFTVK